MSAFPAEFTEERLVHLAEQMREAPARPSKPGMLTRWFHAPRYSDVFIDIAPGGEVDRLEVSFSGHYFLYTNAFLKTGVTDEMNHLHGAPQSRMVNQHNEPSAEVVNAAVVILRHLPDRFLSEFLEETIDEITGRNPTTNVRSS